MSIDNVIYEVNIHVRQNRLAEFDDWLGGHVRHMLELPGFVDAQMFESEADERHALRSVQYRLQDKTALNAYLSEHAEGMRADGIARFGNDMKADRRVLIQRQDYALEHCRNCGSALDGQYCSGCGQRHRDRMISVWELLRDVFEDVISWDSRLWRSLRPLLMSPGKLTNEYLSGRRMYYTPPLRMYLVLSVLFFLLSSFGTFGNLDVEEMAVHNDNEIVAPAPQAEALKDLGDGNFQCGDIEFQVSLPGVPEEALRARLIKACERFMAPGGHQALLREFLDLVPKLLIVMLPLIALASKALYLFSRRYYVEHLLFYTHYHSFAFLFLILVTAMLWLVAFLPGGEGAVAWLKAAAWIYGIYYLFSSMRRVFGQGRFVTGLKFAAVSMTYFVGGLMVAMIGVIIAVLSV